MTDGLAAPVAVVASRVRSDEKRIFAALERRKISFVHLDSRSMLMRDQADGAGFSAVLNREISLSRSVHLAHTLEAWGTQVLNSAQATEVCGNKWRTTLALRKHGVPTPAAGLALTPEAALPLMAEMGFPVVVKPVTGSWGRLVTPVHTREVGELVTEYLAALPGPEAHLVYVQKLVVKPDRDIRVVVIGGRAVGAIYRIGPQWRTNVAQGAQAQVCPLTGEIAALAVAAADATGACIAGVDLVEDQDGQLSVLEVNHGVEFSGFQSAHGDSVDLAGEMVDYLSHCARAAQPELAGADR
jgi:[lysine-biosynthesis-protein LysW]---L-2-aminoadipate ligase